MTTGLSDTLGEPQGSSPWPLDLGGPGTAPLKGWVDTALPRGRATSPSGFQEAATREEVRLPSLSRREEVGAKHFKRPRCGGRSSPCQMFERPGQGPGRDKAVLGGEDRGTGHRRPARATSRHRATRPRPLLSQGQSSHPAARPGPDHDSVWVTAQPRTLLRGVLSHEEDGGREGGRVLLDTVQPQLGHIKQWLLYSPDLALSNFCFFPSFFTFSNPAPKQGRAAATGNIQKTVPGAPGPSRGGGC